MTNSRQYPKKKRHKDSGKRKQTALTEKTDKKNIGYALCLVQPETDLNSMALKPNVLYIKQCADSETNSETDSETDSETKILLEYRVINPSGEPCIGSISKTDLNNSSIAILTNTALQKLLGQSNITPEEIKPFFSDLLAVTADRGHTTGVLHDLDALLTTVNHGLAGIKSVPLLGTLAVVSQNIMAVFKQIGVLCPPIIQSVNAAKKFIAFLAKFSELKGNKTFLSFMNSLKNYHVSILTARIMSFSLYALTAVVYAGVLFTPIVGPAIIAVAAAIDWIGDYFSTKQELKALEAEPKPHTKKILQKIEGTQKKYAALKKNLGWEVANVVSLALSACAPIPVVGPILLAAGLAILGIVVLRNFYVNRQEAKKAKADAESSQLDSTAPKPEHTHEYEHHQRWTVRLKNSFFSKVESVLDRLESAIGAVGSAFSWAFQLDKKTAPEAPDSQTELTTNSSGTTEKLFKQMPPSPKNANSTPPFEEVAYQTPLFRAPQIQTELQNQTPSKNQNPPTKGNTNE